MSEDKLKELEKRIKKLEDESWFKQMTPPIPRQNIDNIEVCPSCNQRLPAVCMSTACPYGYTVTV